MGFVRDGRWGLLGRVDEVYVPTCKVSTLLLLRVVEES